MATLLKTRTTNVMAQQRTPQIRRQLEFKGMRFCLIGTSVTAFDPRARTDFVFKEKPQKRTPSVGALMHMCKIREASQRFTSLRHPDVGTFDLKVRADNRELPLPSRERRPFCRPWRPPLALLTDHPTSCKDHTVTET